jgi:putative ABC transport system substrate-binding protein
MRRRNFILGISASTAWPLAVGAQPTDGMRRIGLLIGWSKNNPEFRGLVAAFTEELARLDWVDGRNAQIEERWTEADGERASAFATELVAWRADVLLSSTTPATAALHRAMTIIPIVFTVVVDPVHAGFVASLPHPGGNITGFRHTEPAFAGKWLNLLKEIAPSTTGRSAKRRNMSAEWGLCRSHLEGRQTCRSAGATGGQIPACHQS